MRPITILRSSRRLGRCRTCNAPIEWARIDDSQRAMPFNPPIVVLPSRPDDPPDIERVDMEATTSHFASCPDAPRWRRRR